jgi:hypothetical protein
VGAKGVPGVGRQLGIAAFMQPRAPYPSPKLTEVPSQEIAAYVVKHKCHGFFKSSVMYGDQSYDVSSLKHDLDGGALWYPDAFYETTLQREGQEPLKIEGTFRHRECMSVDCSKCSQIPQLNDFRQRVLREVASTPSCFRGERVCQQGVRLQDLQRSELIETAAVWKERFEKANGHAYFLNITTARLQTSRGTLQEKLSQHLEEKKLPEVAEVLRRAYDAGYFENREGLLNFILDLGKNIISVDSHGGNAQGKRYHRSTKLMYEMLLEYGGPCALNFMSANLLGPSINTTRSEFRRSAFHYVDPMGDSVFLHMGKVFSDWKAKLGITGLIPFEVAEDEAAVIQLPTWNRRNDTIDGFCGLKTANPADHVCNFDLIVPSSTFEEIKTAFETLKVASHARALVMNPLVAGMPRWIIGIFGTCNKFSAAEVLEQHDRIRSLHKLHLAASIGPLVSIPASDGDARRRKIQLDSIARGTYGLNRPGFIYKNEIVNGFPQLAVQDPPHNAKKGRNPMLLATRNLYLW